jgi:hypothetical protein
LHKRETEEIGHHRISKTFSIPLVVWHSSFTTEFEKQDIQILELTNAAGESNFV